MLSNAREQEIILWIASRRYITGEIKIEELEAIECIESENFKKAVQVMAKRRSWQQLFGRALLKYCRRIGFPSSK